MGTKSSWRSGSLIITLHKLALALILFTAAFVMVVGQTPSVTPTPDNRGLGIQKSGAPSNSQSGSQSREAKPELVLQSGYNSFMGAMRLVFSPDGRLLATGTFRSSTIKLWETATGRELRNLSSNTQSTMSMSPYIAFSRDSRLVAAAAGDNSVRIWDVTSGRELQSLAGSQGSLAASLGVYFIAFTGDGQIVTVSDAIRVWDVTSGRELRTLGTTSLSVSGLSGGEGG
ncbi:WD40 repeat domain-containing protein, partial [Edaphovirga cremea]|uniref:WD40 repeat domain-containing protein n=1 Tax=Edaphovirga cremea TaxID=2267246 RepID=UPI003989D098